MTLKTRIATTLLVTIALVPSFSSVAFAQLASDTPGVTVTPGGENCNGVIPTPGSQNTVKTLIGGTLVPGGKAFYQISYPVGRDDVGDSFEIVDCVLVGTGDDLKDYEVLDEATFDGVVNSRSFRLDFNVAIPDDLPVGSRVCNVAKTTEGPSAPQSSNRKAGPACFIVGGDARVEKRDAADPDGALLGGATFEISDCTNTADDPDLQPIIVTPEPAGGGPEGTVVATGGFIAFSGPSGSTCTVTETVAPPGYGLPPVDERSVTVTIPVATSAVVYEFLDVRLTPDLQITKAADEESVTAGDPIGFLITVSNGGTGPATGVTMTDTLPGDAGLAWSIDGGTGAGACSIDDGVLSCDFGDLAAGASRTVHVSTPTTSASCGTIDNAAVASATNDDDARASDATEVVCPHIGIDKEADDDSVSAGQPIGFLITVHSLGPVEARDVTLLDELPGDAGLAWSIDGGTGADGCSIDAGVLSCDFGTMAAGTDLTVHVSSPTVPETCGTVENTAFVDTSNNGEADASDAVNVLCADLSVTKDADAGEVDGGRQIGFLITVHNAGPGDAQDVTLLDELPGDAGLAWTIDGGTGASDCSIDAGVLTCDFGTLPDDATVTVHVSSPTTRETCGTVANAVTVSASNEDDATAGDAVDVLCPAIAIDKTGPTLAHVGDSVTYTLTVTNPVPDVPLGDVVVSDPICDAAPVFVEGDTGADTILAFGEIWIYTCSHVIAEADGDPVPNTATVQGTSEHGTIVTAQDDHAVDIIHPAVSIVKSADPVSGTPGTTITYTYVVENTGDTTLFDVMLDDDVIGHIAGPFTLEPGEQRTFTTTFVLGAAAVTNVGTVVGSDVLGEDVTDDDDATVVAVLGTQLPRTGSDARGGLGIGMVFTGIGTALVAIARRRKRRGHDRAPVDVGDTSAPA